MFPSMEAQHLRCVPLVCSPKKHYEQQGVRNNVSSFAMALTGILVVSAAVSLRRWKVITDPRRRKRKEKPEWTLRRVPLSGSTDGFVYSMKVPTTDSEDDDEQDEYKTLISPEKRSRPLCKNVSERSTDSGCNVEYRVPDSDDEDKIESRGDKKDEYKTHLSPKKRTRPVRKNVSERSTDSGCNVEYRVPDGDDADKIESRGDKSRNDDAEKIGERTSAAFPSETKENSEDHSSFEKSSSYRSLRFEPSLVTDSLPLKLRCLFVERLDSPSPSPNWRNLAEELGLDIGQIEWLEQLAPSTSPTDALLRMMEAQKYPLSELARILRTLGRDDAAKIIEESQILLRETIPTHEDTSL